jgi:E1A-binding protein p400
MPGQFFPGAADFHISESLSDFGISDSELNYSEDIWQEVDYHEFLPDQDDSSLLPGIEELEPLSDFTDIG